MHQLVVALGEAYFYNGAARLQCHATLNATICSQHGFAADQIRFDVKTLDTLSLFYRVSRPLYFDIDLCFEPGLLQSTQGSSSIGHLVAQQASSDQFWRQLNFRTVSVHETDSIGTHPPSSVQFCLGLEHVDSNTQPSSQESGPVLNANDINYPDCLEIATVTRVSLRLQVKVYRVGKPFHARSAENRSLPTCGNDDTAGGIDKTLTADHTHLHGFLDAAIRCSISPARHRLAPEIRRAAPGFEHTLQTTFPTIFSPLGLQYLAERHPLISGVAKNILRCVSVSRKAFPTLKKHIQSASGGQLRNRQLSLGSDHGTSFDRIESRLWDCLATGARDAQGRVVLNPLLLSEPFADFRVAHLCDQDPVLADRGSTESQFSQTLNSQPSTVDIADLLDHGEALNRRSALLHREDTRQYILQPECLDRQEKEWEDQTSYLPNRSTLEGVVPETYLMEALEVNEHVYSDHDFFRTNSIAGVAQKMLMDDEYEAPNRHLPASTQPGAEDECIVQIWDDITGDAKSLSQTYTHMRSPNLAFSNGRFGRPSAVEGRPNQNKIDTADQIFPSTWSYMLDMFPLVELPSPEKILTPSTSFADFDIFTPNSTQDTGPLSEGISHRQIAKTPATSPVLEELLCEDNSLNNMRWRRGTIDSTGGRMDVVNESDLSTQALSSHLRRSPPDKGVEDTVQQPSSVYTKVSLDQCSPNNKPWKRCSTNSSQSTTSHRRKPSLLRRLSRRSNASSDRDMMDLDFFEIQNRDVDIKRRKTLEDYYADDEMLFD
ncbi:hypothetical protein DV736_g473, partial [Chaetothyriales sp. CBS 134916]